MLNRASTQNSELQDIERCPELWFEDAKIIFQVDNVQFRVHAGMLEARSPVLMEMLLVEKTSDLSDYVEDCRVVLLPDRSEDIRVFFMAIYDTSFFQPPLSDYSLPKVLAVARMSHKYGVPFLRRRALGHLATVFATTLNEWEDIYDETDGLDLSALETIETALELGSDWLLPSAFYALWRLGLNCMVYDERWTTLDLKIQRKCLLGFLSLDQADVPNEITKLDTSPQCETTTECSYMIKDILIELYRSGRGDLLSNWSKNVSYSDGYRGLCEPCSNLAIEAGEQAQETSWQSLPGMLSLPSWEVLGKLKKTDLGLDDNQ